MGILTVPFVCFSKKKSKNKPLLDPQTKTYEKVSAWSWLVKPFAKGVYSNVVEVGGIKKIIDSP